MAGLHYHDFGASSSEEGRAEDTSRSGAPRHVLAVPLSCDVTSCGLYFFACPFACPHRFPAVFDDVAAQARGVRDHVRKHHVTFVPYKTFADPRKKKKAFTSDAAVRNTSDLADFCSASYTYYPVFEHTELTDVRVQRHKDAAFRLIDALPGKRCRLFAYLDVSLTLPGGRHRKQVFLCCYCDYHGSDLEAYKRHAVDIHVRLEPVRRVFHGSAFPVFGPPLF